MNGSEWEKILNAFESKGNIHVFFKTKSGPSMLEKEWNERFPECRIANQWFPYIHYGVIEAECHKGTVTGIWIIEEHDELIRIREADEQTMEIIRSMGTSNIESGVLRLFSYEMTPEG